MDLFIDPGSYCTGAVLASQSDGGETSIAGVELIQASSSDYHERMVEIAGGINRFAGLSTVESCVVEVPSGKVNARRHGGCGAGLSVYGYVVGGLVTFLIEYMRLHPIRVKETEWLGGHSKEKRRKIAMRLWPHYDPKKDKGYDLADALALSEWWYKIGKKKRTG